MNFCFAFRLGKPRFTVVPGRNELSLPQHACVPLCNLRDISISANAMHRNVRAENALEFGTKASNFPEAVPEQASRQGVGPLHSREALRSQAALHTFKIRGVSFDGRQTPVSSLQASEAIMMVPEPENQFDEHAIAIKKLNGDQLGYVPRELNQNAEFQGGVLFGHIKSIGPTMSAPQQLYGAQVYFQPRLPPLHVNAAPRALQDSLASLQGYVSTDIWQELLRGSLMAANGRCSMSGALCNDLVACPWWKEDTRRNKFCLEGVVAMSSQLMQARENLLDDQPLQESLWTVQSINGWISSEMASYLQYLRSLQQQREGQNWTLDLSLLEGEGQTPLTKLNKSFQNLSV